MDIELTCILSKTMACLVVLERHLWLNLREIKDSDKTAFLDSLVSPTFLFGLQAMRHFLHKRRLSIL